MALPTPLTLQLSSSPSLIRRGVVGHGFLNNRRVDSPILASATRSFEVTLRTPTGDKVIQVPEDVYVTDAAESAGIILPVSCRSGNCSSCAAVLKSGIVDQSYQTFLSDEQVADGFVLTCVAYPLSDSVIETHQESRLYS